MAKSPEEMLQSMIANYPAKTGKPFEAWLELVKRHVGKGGSLKHGQIVQWLKSEHGMSHGFANQVALRSLQGGGAAPAGDDLVDAQYSGGKAALRPLYDALVAAARKLGKDVEVSPKKSSVSLRRHRQFALLTPASATRIDVGLQLKGVPVGGRLEKSPTSMCSHRVRVEKREDVDARLLGWMKQAYDAC